LPKQAMPLKTAVGLAQKLADEMGVELVDSELVKEPTGRFLRFYIDKPEGGISLDEIETYHRALNPLVSDVDYDYMEVSSPGVDRPLKSDRDFERAMGTDVEVKLYRALDGSKRFTGELSGYSKDRFEIVGQDGFPMSFAKRDVALVRPLVEVDEDAMAAALDTDTNKEEQ